MGDIGVRHGRAGGRPFATYRGDTSVAASMLRALEPDRLAVQVTWTLTPELGHGDQLDD